MADETVGFIGIGRMGEAIARNLRESGHSLVVYNRTAAKADALVREGAVRVGRPADACSPGGVVITMLSDDAALEDREPRSGFSAQRHREAHLVLAREPRLAAQRFPVHPIPVIR